MLKELFSTAFELVRRPLIAVPELLVRRPYRLVLRMVLLGQSPVYAVLLVSILALSETKKGLSMSPYTVAGIIILAPLLSLLGWVVETSCLHLVARLLGGREGFKTGLLLTGSAGAPYLFAFPFLLFLQSILAQTVFLFANVWSFFLLYLGVFFGYGLGRGRSFLVLLGGKFLLPFLFLLGSFLLV